MAKPIFIPEVEAAKMLNYAPRTLRERAKHGDLRIAYTCINRRKYQYNRLDIEKVLMDNSNILA